MANIKINYDGLQQQSASLRNCVQNYDSIISRTNNLIAEIQAGWQGESSVAYTETLMKYLQQAKQMETVIDRFRSISDIVTTRFSDVDNQCAQMINGSF